MGNRTPATKKFQVESLHIYTYKSKCRGRVGGRERGSGKGMRGASKGRRERGVVVGVMQG